MRIEAELNRGTKPQQGNFELKDEETTEPRNLCEMGTKLNEFWSCAGGGRVPPGFSGVPFFARQNGDDG